MKLVFGWLILQENFAKSFLTLQNSFILLLTVLFGDGWPWWYEHGGEGIHPLHRPNHTLKCYLGGRSIQWIAVLREKTQVLKCLLGSHNTCLSALLGGKYMLKCPDWGQKASLSVLFGANTLCIVFSGSHICAKVISSRPKCAYKCLLGMQNLL